jgi:hypothetical protein
MHLQTKMLELKYNNSIISQQRNLSSRFLQGKLKYKKKKNNTKNKARKSVKN